MNLSRDLKVLSELKPGDTLCVYDMSIVCHQSWSTSFYRYWYGEGRKKTLSKIEECVNEALKNPELKEDLERALVGIKSLSITYTGDEVVQKQIGDIVTKIEDYFDKKAHLD